MDTPAPSSIRADAESNAIASECPWVALQFDDRVFTLSRSSLTGEPDSLFAALFDADSVSGSSVDRNHSHPLKPVIFDRSSRYVEPVLQYLRTGELGVPDDADVGTLRAIYLEASYFGVTGAMEQLADMEPGVTKTPAERRREKASQPAPPNFTRADVERLLMALPAHVQRSSSQGCAFRARWCGINFDGVDFTDLCLAAIDFERCEFNGCKFVRADLSGSNLSNAEMDGADFTGAVLTDVRCVGTLATKSCFQNATCVGADFSRCILVQADFTSANLNNACFDSSDLSESKLAGADLTMTKLQRALLRGVERQGTSLSMGGVIQANSPQDSGAGRPGNAFMRAMGVGSADFQ
jgi:uncharacterized protein YjbI with pentapeptide repeats